MLVVLAGEGGFGALFAEDAELFFCARDVLVICTRMIGVSLGPP